MSSPGLSKMKGISVQDRKMIEDAEVMMGPEPEEMGFVKNLYWGRFRDDLVFPYPQESAEERAACDEVLGELEDYLKNEHPRIEIDQEQYIPDWVIDRLFEMGVLGLTVPKEYGGLGLGITSYNRVLELIGRYCGSTAVMVSAHQSIGCKAIMLFGTEAQKERFLPKVAREYLSAFCLSEPNVGSDAANQETRCVWDEEEECYILNGEKKWSTSGAIAGVFTVMAKQALPDRKTGKTKDKVTALICTPDMEGVDVFQKNRSKTGIRGTWQARIRFTDVKVPKENLLHKEGRGLNVALTCLNFGRCTLSSGVLGAAKQAAEQATKWVQTRYQFGRPLAEFELVQQKLAKMSALTYGMDALLYLTTGMLDRHDTDIMVETACSKVFASDSGWQVIDDAMQIMGGEGYMTENEFERLWRDNRIHRIVEGSNEVMWSFIFAYGGKQLAEQMIAVQDAMTWDQDLPAGANVQKLVKNGLNPAIVQRAIPLGLQLFAGVKPSRPEIKGAHPLLSGYAERLSTLVRDHSHYFKLSSKWEREGIVKRQAQQKRVADVAIHILVLSASLSKLSMQLRRGDHGPAFERDKAAFGHLFDLLEDRCHEDMRALRQNAGVRHTDASMHKAATAMRDYADTLPNTDFYLHEASPVVEEGDSHPIQKEHIQQFPGDAYTGGDGHAGDGAPTPTPAKAKKAKA